MKIIIVGCGKVGKTLAEELNKEDNEVTVIDRRYAEVESLSNKFDVMGVVGNGASYKTQMEAGIEKADILIAVTGSDELNLLCCLIAKRAGNCQTIARVRNPEYSEEIGFVKGALGLAMTINPEFAAAQEIARVLRFPSAIKIDTFAKGRVEMLKFRVPGESRLNGMLVMNIAPKLGADVLVCAVERDGEIFIPKGDFRLQEKDVVSIIAGPKKASDFFKKIGIETHQVKDTMIVGGGDTGYYLAKLLQPMGIGIKLIEQNEERCNLLSELLPKAQIIHADGSEQIVLIEEGVGQAEAFVALTNIDEENVMLSLFARSQTAGKIATKINRMDFDRVIKELDLDTTVYPKKITALYILQFVRAMKNSIGCNVETMYRILDDKAEALEFVVKDSSELPGIPLEKLKIKENTLVACIIRGRQIIIPRGKDEMRVGDSVVVVTTTLGLKDIRDVISVRKQ
ncbi:MAG: Trk system potassium transporter TrkA [Eubacterium sp.]|nr:Trk system potassium transporter TrkA [Eubacterium sp.]MCI9411527.1 Trk system potassium transporter TrkA [Eubacterium sp.]